MAVRTMVRLDPIERDIALLIDEELSPEAQARFLRKEAEAALIDGQEINRKALGYVPDHDTFVDGSRRQGLDAVKASSVILFEFHLLVDVIAWVDAQLILNSPIGRTRKSPEYSKSHVWFADNVEFEDVEHPPPAQSYIVLNSAPYARKIERGLSKQAPDGVYEGVAALAKRRFGNVAYVGFTYRSFPGGGIGQWARSGTAAALGRGRRKSDPRKHQEWLTRQPAIYIDPGR